MKYSTAFFGIILLFFTVAYAQVQETGQIGWLGGLVIILAFAIVVAIIYLMYRIIKKGATQSRMASVGSRLDVLNKQFAKGEISAEEYKQLKKNIKKPNR
ncbi:hypothetical protein CHISP_1507 [Chitinispirillum alkaliphilum]|nr:hypothetical protein CHISP_1507 [Chitinispirillum alkaliphilum]